MIIWFLLYFSIHYQSGFSVSLFSKSTIHFTIPTLQSFDGKIQSVNDIYAFTFPIPLTSQAVSFLPTFAECIRARRVLCSVYRNNLDKCKRKENTKGHRGKKSESFQSRLGVVTVRYLFFFGLVWLGRCVCISLQVFII